jgi:hypothetical protein
LEEAESEAHAARAEAVDAANLRSALERANSDYALARGCIDDLIFAYNSTSTFFEYPRNFRAALDGANCSALGYFFKE